MPASILVIGKESTGKSQLVASLTGAAAHSSNFRGATVSVQNYAAEGRVLVDTPGILHASDSDTTRLALAQLAYGEQVLLVAKATHLDDDLRDILPLVSGKQGAVAVTFWDKVSQSAASQQVLAQLRQSAGLPMVPVDARHLTSVDREKLWAALNQPQPFPEQMKVRAGWRIEPKATWLERRFLGPLLALTLLFAPAAAAVWAANTSAALLEPLVKALIAPLVAALGGLPSAVAAVLTGPYGFVTMFPLMFVWAVPTVILYALVLGAYKASGLLERLTVALHPLTRPIGLSGRDVVRVVMGFGCNVPAVISTRACSACTRQTAISAIAFGSACSYQFGATLRVFAAAQLPGLALPYLLYLLLTTLVYTRLIAPAEARSPLNVLMIERRTFLEWPRWAAVWREARGELAEFFGKAMPVFLGITVAASLLDWLGVMTALAGILSPLMAAFNLPTQAALPVLLASIRKDGLLLFAQPEVLRALTPLQVLTGVYLAGVLLPCLVTALAIAREQSARYAAWLMVRQALAAIAFSLVLAWGGALWPSF